MSLLTSWGEQLDTDAPLPEHPRPQLVRPGWQSLNGPWECAFTPFAASDPVAVADPLAPPVHFDLEIVVPFSPETTLSGVGRSTAPDETLWYRRRFTLPVSVPPAERVMLHFGAVDQSCRVAVDGVEVGRHTGGYLPFSLDITDVLADAVEHEIVVAVRDVTDTSWLSRGKQATKRGGIWYTPQSGIWQTVWLEILPRIAVDRLVLVPDLEDSAVVVTVESSHAPDAETATVIITADGMPAAEAVIPVGVPTRLRFDDAVRTWSPEDPFLYDVEVRLGEDRVTSYVGMRSFGVGTDERGVARLLLNGEPYVPIGLLDQGYWPDGGYTAASDAALEYDIALAKRLGYNMLRKHIKIEPMRWYHHCDRLGMLVWQDAVNGGSRYHPLVITVPAVVPSRLDDRQHRRFRRTDAAGRASFETELESMIELLRSVPSIALWVPFNEGWGQFDAARVADDVRSLDPTRPVDHASGWHDQGAGDLHSQHVYFRRFRVRRRRPRTARVLALTEYGGYSLPIPGHTWGSRTFGYKRFRTGATFEAAFVRLHDEEIVPAVRRGLGAIVYTQLADVEDEVNGLVTYDRKVVKVAEHVVRAMNARIAAAAQEEAS